MSSALGGTSYVLKLWDSGSRRDGVVSIIFCSGEFEVQFAVGEILLQRLELSLKSQSP